MEAAFSVRKGGRFFDEPALDAHLDLLRELDGLDGVLHLTHEGQPDVEVRDELSAVVHRICLTAPVDLLGGSPVFLYRYASWSSHLVVVPYGSRVRMFGEHIPRAVWPAAELWAATVALGARYANLLDRLHGAQSGHAAPTRALHARAAAALLALPPSA